MQCHLCPVLPFLAERMCMEPVPILCHIHLHLQRFKDWSETSWHRWGKAELLVYPRTTKTQIRHLILINSWGGGIKNEIIYLGS